MRLDIAAAKFVLVVQHLTQPEPELANCRQPTPETLNLAHDKLVAIPSPNIERGVVRTWAHWCEPVLHCPLRDEVLDSAVSPKRAVHPIWIDVEFRTRLR